MKNVVIAAVALLLATPLQAVPELQPHEGKWEFEVWYDFIGVPQRFPSYSKTQCVTRADPLPRISRPGHECFQRMQRQFGRTYTWFVNCSTDWEMVQGMGRVNYWKDRAQGDVHVQVINPVNPPQPMIFHIRGKRLGECDGSEEGS